MRRREIFFEEAGEREGNVCIDSGIII